MEPSVQPSPLKINVVEREIGPVLEMEHRCTMFGMPRAMGSGFGAIHEHMKALGTEPKEAPYARYPEINWEEAMGGGPVAFLRGLFKKWHFFTGFPCGSRMDSQGAILANHLGPQKYLSCLHVGPYRDVGKAYRAMVAFAQTNALRIEPWCLEFYLNDPGESGQAKAETVCMIPIASKTA